MSTITLTILEEDIRTTDYTYSKDCAITRAMRRAGFPYGKDCGSYLIIDDYTLIRRSENDSYKKLVERVTSMYAYVEMPVQDAEHLMKRWGITETKVPEDFTHEINY